MKVITVLGTRPEIIRLSRIIPVLDGVSEHILIHTGQNFDRNLSEIFFTEMGIRQPDAFIGARGSFGEQVGLMLTEIEKILRSQKPDKFLVLGDTNSALTSIVAKRLGIPVYHMEAGNRCYDDRVPEEINRRIIDHSSDILLPYTERSRYNLISEGFPAQRIYVTGNPILEVINYYDDRIQASGAHSKFNLDPRGYFLVTLHRAENVDIESRLRQFIEALELIEKKYQMPIIISVHPRTREKMKDFGVSVKSRLIQLIEPLGFFDFIHLERNAFCVLSDSGTVQEESAIFKVPNVTLRDVTERPETVECGSNVLTGADTKTILTCIDLVTSRPPFWKTPPEYLVTNVASVVTNLLMGAILND